MRVALTTVAARVLTIQYLQLAGGLLVIWIAVKVLGDACNPPTASPSPKRFLQAIWYIVVADLTMSTDNILAIAGASRGNFPLILFGLALSIPFVVFASNLISKLMDRYPIIVWLGAAILGDVAGEMIVRDQFFFRPPAAPSFLLVHGVGLVGAAGVVIIAMLLRRGKPAADETREN
jgi:YjbE family integral membrane protein